MSDAECTPTTSVADVLADEIANALDDAVPRKMPDTASPQMAQIVTETGLGAPEGSGSVSLGVPGGVRGAQEGVQEAGRTTWPASHYLELHGEVRTVTPPEEA